MAQQTDLPAEGFVRLPAVLRALGISKSALYEGIRSGRLPKPVHYGRASLWNVKAVRDAIRRIEERGA